MRKRNTEQGTFNQRVVACGNLWILIGTDSKGKPVRAFLEGGKMGTCHANLEAMGRLVTLCLQNNVSLEDIIDQIERIKCPACERRKGKLAGEGNTKELKECVWSCPDAVARELKEFIKK